MRKCYYLFDWNLQWPIVHHCSLPQNYSPPLIHFLRPHFPQSATKHRPHCVNYAIAWITRLNTVILWILNCLTKPHESSNKRSHFMLLKCEHDAYVTTGEFPNWIWRRKKKKERNCREVPITKWHYIITYLLTPWSWVLLEKLTGLQLVKKFPAFYGTRRFLTALTSVRHLSLSWASPIQKATDTHSECVILLLLGKNGHAKRHDVTVHIHCLSGFRPVLGFLLH